MIVAFTDTALEEYNYRTENDKKIHKRIKLLIKEISRSPFESIGKPEPLKHEPSGYWRGESQTNIGLSTKLPTR